MYPLPRISFPSNQVLNSFTETAHVASQYLAMAGKFLTEVQADDSHTNLGWDLNRQWFYSKPLGTDEKFYLCLKPEGLELSLTDHRFTILESLSLGGKTQQMGADWVKQQLLAQGLAAESYAIDLHYELPPYGDLAGATFPTADAASMQGFAAIRSWAEALMQPYRANFPSAGEIRTWPHHFDHGLYIPVSFDDAGKPNQSVSIGLGIHDSVENEPYFYVIHWSGTAPAVYENFPELAVGYWTQGDWKAAILPLSDLLSASSDIVQQEQFVHQFLQQGINTSLGFLGLADDAPF